MSDQMSEPLSDERLARSLAIVRLLTVPGVMAPEAADAIQDVLAEVEWLLGREARREAREAREAQMREMLRKLISDADATYVEVHPYAGIGHTRVVGPFPDTVEQARALLASEPAADSAR